MDIQSTTKQHVASGKVRCHFTDTFTRNRKIVHIIWMQQFFLFFFRTVLKKPDWSIVAAQRSPGKDLHSYQVRYQKFIKQDYCVQSISCDRKGSVNLIWSIVERCLYLELCTPRWAGFHLVSLGHRWQCCGSSSDKLLEAKASGPLLPAQWSGEAQKYTLWWGPKIFCSCKRGTWDKERRG